MLKALADKYETKEFLVGDPSWFMHQVDGATDKELLAFIASSLSYGARKQFLPKIQYVMDCSEGRVEQWLLSGRYAVDVPDTNDCFYRLYTFHTMNAFLAALAEMVRQYGSIKAYVKQSIMGTKRAFDAVKALTNWFATHGSTGVVPKDATSSCKRVCMFLRWMVRDNSPVDLGLWADIIDKKTLIVPMDTHVVQEANRLGLMASKSTSMSAALNLSAKLAEIIPEDPIKGDFALFGLGVDNE